MDSLILCEVNFKEIEYITDDSGVIRKEAKLNLKTLGKRLKRIQNIRKVSDFDVADRLETTDAAPAWAETLELVDDIVAELAVVRV